MIDASNAALRSVAGIARKPGLSNQACKPENFARQHWQCCALLRS